MKPLARPALLAASLLAAPAAVGARPMSVQDVVTAVRVADPQLSPDGRSVAFVRTATDLAAGKRNANVWIVPADGSASPRALTRHEKGDNTPRFAPDGRTLAFLSTRSGTQQVWLLDFAGGEPRRLTDLAAGASDPIVFSPDGKKLAFVSDVYPGCPDEACNRQRREDAREGSRQGAPGHAPPLPALGRVAGERPPPRLRPRPRLRRRHGRDAGRLRLAAQPLRGRRDRVLAGRQGDRLRLEPRRSGRRSLDHEQGRLDGARRGRDGGEADGRQSGRRLRSGVHARRRARSSSAPSAARASRPTAGTSTSTTGRRRRSGHVFEKLRISRSDFCLGRDGRTVYFTAESEGRRDLFEVSLAGGTPRLLKKGGAIGSLQAGPGFLVFTEASLDGSAGDLLVPLEDRIGSPAAKSRRVAGADRRERLVAEGRRPARAREPLGDGCRRRADPVLARETAGLRPGEEVPGRLPDPRRPAGRLGGRLVVPLEPVALGGAGLGRRRCRTRAARRASARSSSTRSRATGAGRS